MSDNQRVAFGWAAPPIKEQFPEMDAETAAHFDQDNKAMVRLHVRGLLTDGQRNAVMKKLTHLIFRAAENEKATV